MKTRKAFYRAVRKISNHFLWDIELGTIRGRSRSTGELFCPITAIHAVRTGVRYPLHGQKIAGNLMGMPNTVISDITLVADHDLNSRKYSRKALLRAVGLA